MQVSSDSISDEELRMPVGLADRSQLGVRFIETTHTFEALPRLIPWRWVGTCLALPVAAILGVVFWGPDLSRPEAVAMACVAVFGAVPMLCLLFYSLNRTERAKGKLFVLDTATRTLDLPRRKLTIPGSQVREVIELQGWVNSGDGLERFAEVSVLVQGDGEELVRYPLAFDTSSPRSVTAAARRVADYLKVPLRVIQIDRPKAIAM